MYAKFGQNLSGNFSPLFWFSVQIWIWGSISNLTLPLISSTFHIRHQKLHDYSLTYNGWSWVDCCTCPGISWSTPSGLPQGISSNFGQRHQKLHDYSLTYNEWFWGWLMYMPWNVMIPLVGLPSEFRVISYEVPKSYINITLNITWLRRNVR